MAYTFDAGPNAVLFMEDSEVDCFASVFFKKFSSTGCEQFFQGHVSVKISEPAPAFETLVSSGDTVGQVQYVIACRIGEGPKVM